MSEDFTKKEVNVDLVIDGKQYAGAVTVYLKDGVHTIELSEDFLGREDDLESCYLYDRFSVASKYNLIKWEAYHQAGLENVTECEVTGFYVPKSRTVVLRDGRLCHEYLAWYFETDDCYVLRTEVEENRTRDGDGNTYYFSAPSYYFQEDMYYCDECGCYIHSEDWDSDEDCCYWCAENRHKVIDEYCESHRRPVVLFGEYESEETFSGLGFELEVDCDSYNSRNNEAVAGGLCTASGLESDEMRFAHDGSLDYGFECISQPHTVKDFWDKQDKWQKMLKYLVHNGYRSHDTRTCGLHIHVSRNMFGKTKEEQDESIARVYTFFDNNWDDLVKVSRRRNFGYCEKNQLDYCSVEEVAEGKATRLQKWRKKSKSEGGHYVALNNANRNTFEYRLGRGTLNAWSFFAWVDLIVTITKNAKRITVGKVNTNDLVSWLGGIKETTAKYIYKRGAFRDTMLTLYPSIEWELSSDDNSNDND